MGQSCVGGEHPRATLSSKMRRGGACVPARTSAQRRFHTKNTHIMRGEFNDGCTLVGQHGQAHRRRPYPSPSYFSTQTHTNKITIYAQSTQMKPTVREQSTQRASTAHAQSAPTHLHQTMRCALTPSGLYFR